MKTILVSGNDTGVGKTWVVCALARALNARGRMVQVVKPVESGVSAEDLGDAQSAQADLENVSAHRFLALPEPLAPLTAAKRAGVELSLAGLLSYFKDLPSADIRLVEGAGGLAVPLDEDGSDWSDFAKAIEVDCVVLVVENRLGAINQSRLLEHYAKMKQLPAVFVLNTIHALDEVVDASNREALAFLSYPLKSIEMLLEDF